MHGSDVAIHGSDVPMSLARTVSEEKMCKALVQEKLEECRIVLIVG